MNNLNVEEIYYLMKGAKQQIKKIEEHITESKQNLNIAINNNDLEWQRIIVDNIEYDTQTICTLNNAIEKLKAI